MLLEFIIATLISPQDCAPHEPLDCYDSYISYQLRQNYREVRPTVIFNSDIPQRYHEHIRNEADRAGWSVCIEHAPGFYDYQEFYKFTFNPK